MLFQEILIEAPTRCLQTSVTPVSMLNVGATKSVSVCLFFRESLPVAVQDVQAFRSVTDQCLAFPCLPEGLRCGPAEIEPGQTPPALEGATGGEGIAGQRARSCLVRRSIRWVVKWRDPPGLSHVCLRRETNSCYVNDNSFHFFMIDPQII
jgi:hypothetical protein